MSTPLELQDNLVEELKTLYVNWKYKNPHYNPQLSNEEEEYIPLKIFAQHIPVEEVEEEDDPIPYVLVRLKDGDDEGKADSENTVRVVFIAGIWDDDHNAQGHRDIMNILWKLYIRFQKNPNLNNMATSTGEFHWMAQEDNYFPYFFGACTMTFNIAAVRREDPYA